MIINILQALTMNSLELYLLLLIAGVLSGFMNTLAGGGATVSLSALLLLGLPPHIANATNRVGSLVGSVTRIIVFQRSKAIDWGNGLRLMLPTALGSLSGAFAADRVSSRFLDEMIVITVILTFVLLLVGIQRFIHPSAGESVRIGWKQILLFYLIGCWVGFLLLGAGTYLLIALVLFVGYDLIKANPVKAVLIFGADVASLLLFMAQGQLDWLAGLILSAGNIGGSWVAARVALQEGSRKWIVIMLFLVVLLDLASLFKGSL